MTEEVHDGADPMALLSALPQQEADLFARHHFNGETFTAIAKDANVTRECIRKRWGRIEKRLLAAMEKDAVLRGTVRELQRALGKAFPVSELESVPELAPWIADEQATSFLCWLAAGLRRRGEWLLQSAADSLWEHDR